MYIIYKTGPKWEYYDLMLIKIFKNKTYRFILKETEILHYE